MDEKEVKQEADIETESSEEIEFYWDLFNIDLCDIIRTDLKSLFTPQIHQDDGNNNADSIYLDTKQQETAAQKKQISENGQILISNVYGKMFILYPAHNTLITFDSNRLTNHLNETQTDPNNKNLIPERGISPPRKLYRVFTNIIANKMKLSFDQKHIALCSNTSFKVYHIAQFFNEIHPNPLWKIEENVFQFDWNENSLFLAIDSGNKRTLKHYTLLNNGYKLIGPIPNIPHDIITEITVLSKDIFAVCLANGFVIIYKYSTNGEYRAIHSININKQHSKSSQASTKTIPYLLTDMKGCNSICVHYGIQSAQTADKYLPYFCIFKYDSLDFKAVRCVLCEHTGLNEINNDFEGIKSLYIGGELDYLIFCCRYDYMLSVYDANRNVLDTKGFVVKYDEDRDNGNVCDVGIDYVNTVACMDLETDQSTLPPVPIVYILTNKLNIGCFNLIPYDSNYNDKQLLAIMRTSIHSLPPIPIPIDNAEMPMHVLDKYKKLYCGYFKQLYLKYAPESIGKIAKLMQKYSSSYAQLQGLYEKLITKYKVDQNDIKPLISVQEIEQMQFDENGEVVVMPQEPQTPLQLSPKHVQNDNNDDDSLDIADISAILTFVDDENDVPAVQTPDDTDTDNKQSANIVNIGSKPVGQKKEKAVFSAAVFDHNVPNEEVAYEFFNAFKQIQVEIERVRGALNTFSADMDQSKLELNPSVAKYNGKLNGLTAALKTEKLAVNRRESELFESSLKSKHQSMYAKAMQLTTKCEKLKDATYIKALKRRGLNQQQENTLCGISSKINEAQLKIDELRTYKHDETDLFANNDSKASPNYIFQRCIQVESIVGDRYEKYLNLIETHAPHLLIKQLCVSTPKSRKKASSFHSFVSSVRESLPSSPDNDPLYQKYASLRNKKPRFNRSNTATPQSRPSQFASHRLSKYEKRLNYKNKPYNYKQFITPITPKTHSRTTATNTSQSNTTQTTASQSPTKSPYKRKASPFKPRKHDIDLRNFQTKIQRTPCKSCKKPAELKRLLSYKQLSRQKSIISQTPKISEQKKSALDFKRTPGFRTVRRSDRKQFVRNEILNQDQAYKPPQKPDNFIPFSPKKDALDLAISAPEVPSTPTPPLTPKTCNFTAAAVAAVAAATCTPPQTRPAAATHDILGLTTTPPLLQAVPVEVAENKTESASAWRWAGNDDKKEVAPNENGGGGGNETVADLVGVYKQRIGEIYAATGQGGSDKLRKVMANIDSHRGDGGWIHNLYLKICKKYNVNAQAKVAGNDGGNGAWFGNGNGGGNNNSGGNNSWASNSFGGGETGFGSMNNWNAAQSAPNQKNANPAQSTNVFSNLGGGGGGDKSSWNWGSGATNQGNGGNNNNNNANNMGNSMGFASSSSSNQPSWVNNNLSSMASGGGNNNNASDPFAAFANNNSGGFSSLLN